MNQTSNSPKVAHDTDQVLVKMANKKKDNEKKTIKKGDKFLCINRVMMRDGAVAYTEGHTYVSEIDGCITDDMYIREHQWPDKAQRIMYFRTIK